MKAQIPGVQKLLVTGYSAGGAATSSAYYFVRKAINPARGYLLNDSGPIYLAPNVDALSRALHDKIRQSWNLNSVFSLLPGTFDQNNFGSINRMVAQEFPNDQLAYTGYTARLQLLALLVRALPHAQRQAAILSYWKADQDKLVAELNLYNNFSYFIPYHRPINDSHCSTVITFIGAHACQRMEKKQLLVRVPRVAAGPDVQVLQRVRADGRVPQALDHRQPAHPHLRAGQQLQQRGPGHERRRRPSSTARSAGSRPSTVGGASWAPPALAYGDPVNRDRG